MSERPQSSGFRAPRGPAIVAGIGVGMLVTAIAGAVMLFLPTGGQPTASTTPSSSSSPTAEAEAKADTGRQVPVSREQPDNSAQGVGKVVVPTVPPPAAPQPKAHPPQTRTAAPAPRDDDGDRSRCRDRDGDGWPDRWCRPHRDHDGGSDHDWGGAKDWWRDHSGEGWTSDGGGWGG
ncbi:hypothetical protein EKO23_00430 [Nocardioides guangzhouensis]|uniref:Uncharacterized protein n=1 Tax=Nocardioides guangzhouensis TaxID=2497878 RepID=A0A4Q4ZMU4_9ACTN|nr:hypothetical protein [Nocardioides guangzhouensis]RYP88941.1 hypothetical protein EKO23_00430 [Nocardioides guangzhouensis]